MRSITTRASEGRVTCVKIDESGQLLFTAGSDGLVSVWELKSGDRLGTYHYIKDKPYDWNIDDLREQMRQPKTTLVSHIDVNRATTELAACRFDYVIIYDVPTGRLLDIIEENGKVVCCEWNRHPKVQDKLLVGVTTVGATDAKPRFKIYKCSDLDNPNKFKGHRTWTCVHTFDEVEGNPTVCAWGPLDKFVIGGTELGKLYMWNAETGKVVHKRSAHSDTITCISFNKTRSICLTVSRDYTAKLWNTLDFSVIREIKVDRPLNACTLNPLFDCPDESKRKTTMLLAGGQAAGEVTTSSATEGFFEVLIVDAVTGEEENRLLTHYSPTVCLYYHPDGQTFASGAYEGNAKIFFTD